YSLELPCSRDVMERPFKVIQLLPGLARAAPIHKIPNVLNHAPTVQPLPEEREGPLHAKVIVLVPLHC
ncbi:MAG: hypothetical protein ACK53Y_07560, partial [bacterium]